jgi:hypothetical protein
MWAVAFPVFDGGRCDMPGFAMAEKETGGGRQAMKLTEAAGGGSGTTNRRTLTRLRSAIC